MRIKQMNGNKVHILRSNLLGTIIQKNIFLMKFLYKLNEQQTKNQITRKDKVFKIYVITEIKLSNYEPKICSIRNHP